MSRRKFDRLLLPWEEERDKMPRPVKVILFVVILAAILGVMANTCSVREVEAQSYSGPQYRGGNEERILRRREVKALESIADSLKKIERKMK